MYSQLFVLVIIAFLTELNWEKYKIKLKRKRKQIKLKHNHHVLEISKRSVLWWGIQKKKKFP